MVTDALEAAPGGQSTARRGGGLAAVGASWGIVLLCMVPAVAYYAFLICHIYGDLAEVPPRGDPSLFAPILYGHTFNSMLLHLLRGAFDVDPQTIGPEGIVHNGLTYSYFGILLALIRLPFVAMRDFATTDFTRLSCLAAASLMGASNLAAVLTVWRAVGRPQHAPLLVVFIIALLFGGAQIQFLMPSIWQEVTLWAAALASAFVYLIIHAYYSPRGLTRGLLAGLAAVAGLCLLTRVSTALGLYVALGLLMLQLLWQQYRGAGGVLRLGMLRPVLLASLILGLFIAMAAFVNYQRWGDPLAFTGDAHSYLLETPERLAHEAMYGQFNIVRLGYALAYYFVPVWVLRTADGSLLWSSFQHRTIDAVELPPGSFFVSDPLLVALMLFALVQLVRQRAAINRAVAVPALIGLFVPVALILTFSSMTFRYRLEFYPFFDFAAFLGLGLVLARPKPLPLVPVALVAMAGVVASHGLWLLYLLGRYGDATQRLAGMDVVSFYRSFFH